MRSIRSDWQEIRRRVEGFLGQRKTPKDRSYSRRRQALAHDLGIEDVTLKGFLQANQSLGAVALVRLLARAEFHDLQTQFPGLVLPGGPERDQPLGIQLELDFEGFEQLPEGRILRFPVGSDGVLRLTIRKIS